MSASPGHKSFAVRSPHARWRRVLLLALVPTLCMLLFLSYAPVLAAYHDSSAPTQAPQSHLHAPSPSPSPDAPLSQHDDASQSAPAALPSSSCPAPPEREDELDPSMAAIIKALYGPMLHPVDAANFTDEDGKTHRLAGEPRHKKKLGKRVLVLDVDSRPLTEAGQLMAPTLTWKDMRPLSAGMLSHYMYAQIHGYDYKFIHAPDYVDRWGTWVKVPMMREGLKTHDYVVFMDSDAMFHYPHLPLEWLMNYWDMANDTLAMMSIDPDEPQNYDEKGNRYLNTGFVIAQQSQRAQDMFKAWAECPEETRYPGCARWKSDWAHEQAAFGNYIRYDFDRPNDFKVLPCEEANGAPEASNRGGCKGTFVRHFWVDKGLLAKGMADSVMQYFLPRLFQAYHEGAADHIMEAKGYKIQGVELSEMTDDEKDGMTKEGGKNQKDEGFKAKLKHKIGG